VDANSFTKVLAIADLIDDTQLCLMEARAVRALHSANDEQLKARLATDAYGMARYALHRERALEWVHWADRAINAHEANLALLGRRLSEEIEK
jgi:hypothetical protein